MCRELPISWLIQLIIINPCKFRFSFCLEIQHGVKSRETRWEEWEQFIIAVFLAKSFYQLPQLTFPQRSLPKVWNHAVADAIVEGNHLYDTTFSRPGLILDVIEVVDILSKNNCEETISASEALPVWLSAFTESFSCTLQFHLSKLSKKKGKNAAVFVCSKTSF